MKRSAVALGSLWIFLSVILLLDYGFPRALGVAAIVIAGSAIAIAAFGMIAVFAWNALKWMENVGRKDARR